MNQKDAYEFFTPLIEFSGKIYKKTSPVYAYLAEPGEYIETWTEDGLETTNYAKNGDYIVQNLNTIAKEKYIVTSEVFHQRYEKLHNHENGFIMSPLGKVKGCVFHGLEMEFIAAWGRVMVIKAGDMIVTPLPHCNEVYRIARKEFDQTYILDINSAL